MDTRFIFILIWCACNNKEVIKALFTSAILNEEEILSADNIQEQDFEINTASSENAYLRRNSKTSDDKKLKTNFNRNNPDADNYMQSLVINTQYDQNNEFGINDKLFNDSPMSKFGGSYPYPIPARRQTPEKLMYTREILLKQGRLKGIIRNMHPQTGLGDIDQFLGIPYAEAPVASRRFMPPGTPLPWQGLKIARHLPPVCPQRIPDISNGNIKLSKGRYEQLIRLLPYLKTENEDCLYLNVYVPHGDGSNQSQRHSVIVYVHGESFEWNSGNPYDGSVLASYGQVIVVTINYRLGVLGFMRPGVNDDTVSNFGILDQIAALQWIKENIGAFNGDENSVTLMGHSTGAACINYLMLSPVASGLFHRAILMSGSAMADWASSNNSLQLTMQVAHGLNCPLNVAYDKLLSCLRSKRYEDIQKISTPFPQFSTALAPIVDGHVIPNQPYKAMSQYTELFSRYDLLFGVTESESFHLLNAPKLEGGMPENERDNLLRLYMQNRFNVRPDLALAATLKRYTDIYNNPVKASNLEHRDVVLDILSDARVVGPLIQTGLFHADVNPRSYMYVFGHNSAAGPHSTLPHSITGEELAFVFGAPLTPAGPFHNKFNAQEKLLSEAVMSYWTNFAKTGNPKAPWKGHFINLHALEWDRYDLDWPEFNKRNQCYINIGIPPSTGYRYRQVYMNFWNKELPDELNQISSIQQHPHMPTFPLGQLPRGGTSVYTSDIPTGEMSKFPPSHRDRNTEDPQRTLRLLLQKSQPPAKETAENMYNAPPTFGIVYHEKNEDDSRMTTTVIPSIDAHLNEKKSVAKSDSTMQLLIWLIAVFIIFNVIIYSTFLLQKKKKTAIMSRKLGILSYDGKTDDDIKRSKNTDADDSYILDMVGKSNTYEAVKTSHSSNSGFKITRQLSFGTIDAHTKACDWMSQENATKVNSNGDQRSSPTVSLRNNQLLKRDQKVSVAIDATPQARSNSVLRQEPIEVTKLKAGDSRNLIICQEVDFDIDLITKDSIDSRCSQTYASSSLSSQQTIADNISTSDTLHGCDEKVTSFINEDINVTCREPSAEKYPLTPDQQIYTIKRRNFPKVLPNYPLDSFGKQITVQTRKTSSSGTNDQLSKHFKRNSLPPNSLTQNQVGRMPPAPPPRTFSTLGRRPPSLHRQSHSITTSPLMLAQNCPEEKEPEISQNTLIVGPILPKRCQGNYSTVNKRKFNGQNIELTKMDSEQGKSYISVSTPVTPSPFEHGMLGLKSPSPTLSVAPTYSTFHPKHHAHHTEAKYTIQPHITDLTPLVIKQTLQQSKSNIPRVHFTGGGPTSTICSVSGSNPSLIQQNKTAVPQSSSSSSFLHGASDSATESGRNESFECSISGLDVGETWKSSISTSTSSLTSSSSGHTTNSSTETIKTELKQK